MTGYPPALASIISVCLHMAVDRINCEILFDASESARASELLACKEQRQIFAIFVSNKLRNYDTVVRMVKARTSGSDSRSNLKAILDVFAAGTNFALLSVAFAGSSYDAIEEYGEAGLTLKFKPKSD